MPTRFLSKPHIYEIKKLLGESHLSQVYLVERSSKLLKAKQSVVLKIFKQKDYELPDLQIESLLRAQQSPHLVQILNFEHINDQPALILEYIHGVNLKQLLTTTRLGFNEKAYICHEILQGLKELEQIGLAHGDLSLSNILIDYTGKIYLIDYGLANYKGNCLYGTQPFTAPEIHSFHKPNFLSDLFSLGVLEKVLKANFSESELLNMENSHFTCKNDCLLDIRPYKRKVKNFSFSPNTHYLLGSTVNKILFTHESLYQQHKPESILIKTQYYHLLLETSFKRISNLFHIHPQKLFKLKHLGLLPMMFLILLFSVNPFTSHGQYLISTSSYSEVLIRTQKWVYIELAGHKGYSPLNILIPRTGIYEIKWRTQNQKGKQRIHLTDGQKVILRDNDFQ